LHWQEPYAHWPLWPLELCFFSFVLLKLDGFQKGCGMKRGVVSKGVNVRLRNTHWALRTCRTCDIDTIWEHWEHKIKKKHKPYILRWSKSKTSIEKRRHWEPFELTQFWMRTYDQCVLALRKPTGNKSLTTLKGAPNGC
jgi:hypothetical protein